MDSYEKDERPGSLSLDELARCIRLVESGGLIFAKNEVRGEGAGSSYNLMLYSIYRDGPLPPAFELKLLGGGPRSGYKEVWTGRMLVEGTESNVALHRMSGP